jgi:outer membrane receptor protein involved in Fe transport
MASNYIRLCHNHKLAEFTTREELTETKGGPSKTGNLIWTTFIQARGEGKIMRPFAVTTRIAALAAIDESSPTSRLGVASQRALLIAGVAGASLLTGMPCMAAAAQAAQNVGIDGNATDGDNVGITEIVVTASKRDATTVLKAPTSIQAISGESLQKQGVIGFMDVAGKIPGLAVQDLGPGDRKYVIRGISSTGASTTGVYYDEAVISGSNANDGGGFQSDIRLYDLDRIEVLRGPQGTLYGAGSMSGTIRFITKKPDLNEFSGYASGEVSSTSHGGTNYNANGALNLPVVSDKVALRLVGWGIDDSGFIDQVRVGRQLEQSAWPRSQCQQ